MAPANAPPDPEVLPISVVAHDLRALVVGGGPTAASRAQQLLGVGADVVVVAPEVEDSLAIAVAEGRLRLFHREFRDDDLEGVDLVFASTRRPGVDARVAAAARSRHVPVNSHDDPANSTFFMPAEIRRGSVVVAVSTSGLAPSLASYLRRHLEALLPESLAMLAREISSARRTARARGRRTTAIDWSAVVDDDLVAAATRGDVDDVRRRLDVAVGAP
jgi:siroheme synthase-like protein